MGGRGLWLCPIAGDAVGDGELLHQAVPDFRRHGRRFSFSARRGAGRFRLWRRSRCRRWARLLHAGRHAAYGLGVMNEFADFNAIIINTENIPVLKLNLTPTLQRDIIQYHAGNAAAVRDAAFATGVDVNDGLQTRDGAVIVRQHQIVIRTAPNGAARGIKITAALRRLMTGFRRNNRESHGVFLLV